MPPQTLSRTVLILGANGRFGQAATLAFAAAGWRVLAQVRRASAVPFAESLPSGATLLALPLHDAAGLLSAAAQATVVVHAINPVYTRWAAEAMPALHHGLAVARGLGALFMLPGNVYNFGASMPPLLKENTPQRPNTPQGRLRCAMEDHLQSQAEAGAGARSVVIRAGDFFGAGTGSWLDQAIVKSLPRGKLVYPGPLELQHAWAYLPDLARAFVAVANQPPAAAFETLHFAGFTLTGHELLAAIDMAADGLGLRPARGFARGSIPWALLRTVGLVHPPWRALAHMSYLWNVPHALDGSRLGQAYRLAPSTPLPVAMAQALTNLGLARAQEPAQTLRSSYQK